jgi:hypothetical protein
MRTELQGLARESSERSENPKVKMKAHLNRVERDGIENLNILRAGTKTSPNKMMRLFMIPVEALSWKVLVPQDLRRMRMIIVHPSRIGRLVVEHSHSQRYDTARKIGSCPGTGALSSLQFLSIHITRLIMPPMVKEEVQGMDKVYLIA